MVGVSLKSLTEGEHLIERRTEAPDVRPPIDLHASPLFRHMYAGVPIALPAVKSEGRRAELLAFALSEGVSDRASLFFQVRRQAEIDDPALPPRIDHQVRWLEVSMDDVQTVNVLEGVRGIRHDRRDGAKVVGRQSKRRDFRSRCGGTFLHISGPGAQDRR